MNLWNPFANLNNLFSGMADTSYTPSVSFLDAPTLPDFTSLFVQFDQSFKNFISNNATFSTNNIWNCLNVTLPTNNCLNNFNFNFSLPAFNFTSNIGDSFTYSGSSGGALQLQLVNKAKSYIGKVNSDSEGNRLFSGGRTRPWCADFVAYNIKQTFGSKLPSSFSTLASVNSLRDWGKSNNCYMELPASQKANFIANNVKVGDIMIEKKGGKSHTGIVTAVNADGSFKVVEGNCSNKVKERNYSANSSTLSGFISMSKFC